MFQALEIDTSKTCLWRRLESFPVVYLVSFCVQYHIFKSEHIALIVLEVVSSLAAETFDTKEI